MSNLFRTKTIEQSIADTEEGDHQLRKQLGPLQLTVFGVGVVIGTGIFVLTGEAAGEKAGPAVALSFVFAGIACALAAAVSCVGSELMRLSVGRRKSEPRGRSVS